MSNTEHTSNPVNCPACGFAYHDPYKPGAHSCFDAQKAEIDRLRKIERLILDGIHSCHDQCPRIACVRRREIERLAREYSELEDRYCKEGIVKNELIARQAAEIERLTQELADQKARAEGRERHINDMAKGGATIIAGLHAAKATIAELTRESMEHAKVALEATALLVEARYTKEERDRLRAALEWVSRLASEDGTICDHRYLSLIRDAANLARQALAHEPGGKL